MAHDDFASSGDQDTSLAHPPTPRLSIRISAAACRPDQIDPALQPELRPSVRELLALVQRAANDIHADAAGVYSSTAPALTIVSTLAGNADRVIVEEGLRAGFSLQGILPWAKPDYAQRLAAGPGGADALRLLDRMETVLELDGSASDPDAEARAHQAAGELALKHCELLIAVYQERPAGTRDPNAELADSALALGIPVAWIDAAAPSKMTLLVSDAGGKRQELDCKKIPGILCTLLLPPEKSETEEEGSGEPRSHLHAYCAERQRRHTHIGWAWYIFFSLLGDRKPALPRFRVPDCIASTQAEWREEWRSAPTLPPEMVRRIEESLLQAYAWADKLAIFYANAYRSTYLLSYLLGVFGVLCELIADTGVPLPAAVVFQCVAFGCLVTIVGIWWAGSRGHWHERWIDYRLLAELLRQLRFLSLLGRVPVFSRLPAHEAYDNPHNTWINWYLRAVAREAGILPVQFTDSYLESLCTLYREGILADQRRYHDRNAKRHRQADAALRRTGLLAFGLTFVLLALRVAGTILGLAAPAGFDWLMRLTDSDASRVLTVWLPIVGGAIAAIRTQTELERVAKRSKAMSRQLEQLANALKQMEPKLSAAGLAQVAESAAQAMIAEVLDWRIVFEEKPLELSG